jgi:hypothetical protein
MSLLTKLFNYVLLTTKKYGIDESHGMSHSMNALHFAHNIYEAEKKNYPILERHERIIYVSAIIHDMCDKKYMDEDEGVYNIGCFLRDEIDPSEIDAVKRIVRTMSYSKVKKYGFPDLQEYQMAYHVVREADLLSAYDFDRCMLYNIHCKVYNSEDENSNMLNAFSDAHELFHKRVFKHEDDSLLITDYSKGMHNRLSMDARFRIDTWKKILQKPTI